MNRGLLIVLSIFLIGNLAMYFYQNPFAVSDGDYTTQRNLPTKGSPPTKESDLISSIAADQKDKEIHNKPINHVTHSIKKETNSPDYAWNPQTHDTGEKIDPDDELMMENISWRNGGQITQDTGEFIDPDDEFTIENVPSSTGEQEVQNTGEFIDPDE